VFKKRPEGHGCYSREDSSIKLLPNSTTLGNSSRASMASSQSFQVSLSLNFTNSSPFSLQTSSKLPSSKPSTTDPHNSKQKLPAHFKQKLLIFDDQADQHPSFPKLSSQRPSFNSQKTVRRLQESELKTKTSQGKSA
jgi:hypothetical protein